ncbi:hypothetical protein SLE2022_328070 [Rubroshorea leprosula]
MIPDWFNHQNTGGSMVVDVPQLSSRTFQGLAACVVYYSVKDLDSGHPTFRITMEDINSSGYYYKYIPMFIGYHDNNGGYQFLWSAILCFFYEVFAD